MTSWKIIQFEMHPYTCLSFFFYGWRLLLLKFLYEEEFEDTKGVVRIHKSKKDRQHNVQMKKYKRTNNDLQSIHIKLTIE